MVSADFSFFAVDWITFTNEFDSEDKHEGEFFLEKTVNFGKTEEAEWERLRTKSGMTASTTLD